MGQKLLIFHICLAVLATTASHALGDVKLANGVIIQGEVRQATAEGLDVDTRKGLKTYPWDQLSPSTRYRHDPMFRANYEVILAGEPPSARTNQPLAEAEEETAETEQATDTEKAEPAANIEGLKIFDHIIYENINPIPSSAYPGLSSKLKSPELATYWGLQYGPGQQDLAYLAFDTKAANEPHDTLHVYAPSSSEFVAPVEISGTKRRKGVDRVVAFKDFALGAQFGPAKATFDIECISSSRQGNPLEVVINGRLENDEYVNTFTLVDEPEDFITGDGIIRVRGIIDLPVLWVQLDPASGGKRLIGTLKMSRMRMIPRQGMDSRVTLTINDMDGTTVDEESIKLETGDDAPYPIVAELDKLSPGTKYRIVAEINLGPFLGTVTYRTIINIPGG